MIHSFPWKSSFHVPLCALFPAPFSFHVTAFAFPSVWCSFQFPLSGFFSAFSFSKSFQSFQHACLHVSPSPHLFVFGHVVSSKETANFCLSFGAYGSRNLTWKPASTFSDVAANYRSDLIQFPNAALAFQAFFNLANFLSSQFAPAHHAKRNLLWKLNN